MDMMRAHLYISGYVQGVAYRYSAIRQAKQLSVTGWVKNLRDGRVEAVIEGGKSNVEQMIDWCRSGPNGASVSGVDVRYLPYRGEFLSFELAW